MDKCREEKKAENRRETQSGIQGLETFLSFIFYFAIPSQAQPEFGFFFLFLFSRSDSFFIAFCTCIPTNKMCTYTYTRIN